MGAYHSGNRHGENNTSFKKQGTVDLPTELFFGSENGLYHCLLCIGEMKTVGRGCRMRPEGPKIEAEGRERVGFLGGGSKPHQLGGLAVM